MHRVMLATLMVLATASAIAAQNCAGGICGGFINPNSGLPRGIAGGAPGLPGGTFGRNPFEFQTDALGVTRDQSGNILPPTDSLGLTRTRDGRICSPDANGLLQCR